MQLYNDINLILTKTYQKRSTPFGVDGCFRKDQVDIVVNLHNMFLKTVSKQISIYCSISAVGPVWIAAPHKLNRRALPKRWNMVKQFFIDPDKEPEILEVQTSEPALPVRQRWKDQLATVT